MTCTAYPSDRAQDIRNRIQELDEQDEQDLAELELTIALLNRNNSPVVITHPQKVNNRNIAPQTSSNYLCSNLRLPKYQNLL